MYTMDFFSEINYLILSYLNTPIYCSKHASIVLYIIHISFTYTVTRLTSTLIRSVKCYKSDYHDKKNTCINLSTIITYTQCASIQRKTLFSSVLSDRHNIHEEHMYHYNFSAQY